MDDRGMNMGSALAARRGELGLSIRDVASATRISAAHIRALEAGDWSAFAAPVYARGMLRAYARYVGLDEAAILDDVAPRPREGRPTLEVHLDEPRRSPRGVLTAPAAAAAAITLLIGASAGYAWRQAALDPHPGHPGPALAAPSSPAVSASAAPSAPAQPRPIVLGVRVSDAVWINVAVDGQPQYGDLGTTLAAGSIVYFTGVSVKLTSGKAASTFVSIDGKELGPLGTGVATRDFSSQTSP